MQGHTGTCQQNKQFMRGMKSGWNSAYRLLQQLTRKRCVTYPHISPDSLCRPQNVFVCLSLSFQSVPLFLHHHRSNPTFRSDISNFLWKIIVFMLNTGILCVCLCVCFVDLDTVPNAVTHSHTSCLLRADKERGGGGGRESESKGGEEEGAQRFLPSRKWSQSKEENLKFH